MNMANEEISPFKVDIPKAEVDRLKRKLQDTRLPPREIVPNAGDRYGPPYQWARDLYDMWINDFDWFPIQDDINSAPHFLTTIEDVKIHFVHATSERKDAIPLLMVHGWPGSFFEFSKVWHPLSKPDNQQDPAFHVVVPSMPGFCWSDWPPKAGWKLHDNARIFHQLMQRLGYKEYMVQCGDWGHWVGRELGAKPQYADACKLVHFNFAPAPLPDNIEYTEREKTVKDRVDDWLENHMGYAVTMRTRPHTIGFAFNDNPVAILMWVGEKYLEAAQPEKQGTRSWMQSILTTSTLYYFTDCIMPTMLCYYENVRHENFAAEAMKEENRIRIPFGYTSFYWDTEPSSKRAVERTGNLVWYNERDDAGHYAALESPEGIVEDLRKLAQQEWK